MKKFISFLGAAGIFSLPAVAFAQTINDGFIGNLFQYALHIINDYLVPLIFAVAFIMFLFMVFRYFIQGGANEESIQQGRKFVMWSVVGFFLMFSLWGLVNLLINTLGLDSSSMPNIPTFDASSATSGTNTTNSSLGAFGTTNTTSSNSLSSDGCPIGYTAVNGVCQSSSGNSAQIVNEINGECPSGYTAITTDPDQGSSVPTGQCMSNSAVTSQGGIVEPARGSVNPGGTCLADPDCADANGQTYGCYKTSGQSRGSCTVDGDAPADGTVPPGGTCTNDNSCEDAGGKSYGCANGICTMDGEVNTADGSVNPGGACTSDPNCADVNGQSYGCYQGTCTADGDTNTTSDNSDNGN